MAPPAVSFDDIIQEGRKKRKAELLAQEIFGKNRRSSATPTGPRTGLGGSLASRVGVAKRTDSPQRVKAPRAPRPPRPVDRPAATDKQRARPDLSSPYEIEQPKSNGQEAQELFVEDVAGDLVIKGAASGPYIVVAQNFAPGTTAADIDSVMVSVGGEMTSCRLVASNPTVIAEMAFVDRAGAEAVIETFNGKKADGRPLYVYWKSGPPTSKSAAQPRRPAAPEVPQTPALGAGESEDVVMEVDNNVESREAENRRREERRGGYDRGGGDVMPPAPRGYRSEMDEYREQRPSRREPSYADPRNGYGNGGRDDSRGWYPREDSRRYGGQRWRR